MTWNIQRLRAETPGCTGQIYLDNAGSALMPDPVIKKMSDHLAAEAKMGGYRAAEAAAAEIEAVYASLAGLLGAKPSEIAVLASATDAWDRAFYSLEFAPGDRIVTAWNEYCANYLAYLHMQKRKGVEITVIGANEAGDLDLGALEAAIDDKTRLISLSHMPSSSGQVIPAAEVGRLARAARVPFLLDACQSVGQMPVDVDEIGCDMLTGTARKFLRGPRGMGFLYIREAMLDRLDPAFLTNQGAVWTGPDAYELTPGARRFEAWERNVAAQLGLGAAVDYTMALGLSAIRERSWALAARLRAGLADLPAVAVHDLGSVLSAIVTFTVEGLAAAEIKERLAARDVHVQVAQAHHTLLDMQPRGLESVVRASPHYYNTEDEIDRTLEFIANVTSAA